MLYTSILAALTAATAVGAASDKCSFSTTVKAATAISDLNSCETLDGTIKITGDDLGDIDLSGVQEIKGDINFFNSSSVTSINLNQLKKISGSLAVNAYTQLHSIDFTSLSEVEKLSLISLPSFAILNLNTGVSKAGSIEISDTALSSLQGLTNYDTVKSLNVNNNKNITSIDLALQTVDEDLTLSFNSDDCEVKLNELIWSSNLTIQDVSDFSASNLTAVNGTLNIAYNKFDQFDLKELTNVGGSVLVFANDEMTSFDLSSLKNIGGELRIFNNTELEDMNDTFKKLAKVKGAVNINGAFHNLTMPGSKEVDGDFTVVSTSDEFSCQDFNKLKKNGDIEGHNYKCSAPKKEQSSKSNSSKSSSGSGSSSSDSSDSSSSSSSDSGKKKSGSTKTMAGMTFVFAVVGAVIAMA